MKLFRISLGFQMAIATVLGILCGLFFGDLCDVFAPYADAYIMILKVTAIPYLIVAIIHGVGQLTATQAKQILKKGIFFVALIWAVNLMLVYTIYYLLPQPTSSQVGSYVSTETPQINFADLLIPDNIFYDLANNIIPAVVIFSLLIGVALLSIKRKDVIMQGLEDLVAALTKATAWIARITPIGTFLIMSNQIGTIQVTTMKQVATYIILFLVIACALIFWILPRLVGMLSTLPFYRWIQQMTPILVLAYTTNVIIVCLPYIIELLKKETEKLDPYDEKGQNQIQGTVSVTFNLPLGSLFMMGFILFISVCYSIPMNLLAQAKLFVTICLNGLGSIGIGSWINSLTFTLDSLGLPLDAINLYLTIIPFTAGFSSMISVMEIAIVSLFITLACRKRLSLHFSKILKQGLLTLAPFFLIILAIKFFNPLPEIKNETKSIYELNISSSIPVTIAPHPQTISQPKESAFERIVRTKVLRVGYDPETAPFCFLNTDSQIVGYDIAFAYELAYDLGCSLELVPIDYSTLGDALDNHLYDVAMSAISISEPRLKSMAFTTPYLHPKFCLVVQNKMKKMFSTVESIYRDKKVKIAALKGSSFENMAKELFPQIPLILIDNYDTFKSDDPYLALLWDEQEAMAWAIKHKEYRVVFPLPALGLDTLAYGTSIDNLRLKNYLDEWLELKKTQGFTEKQYDLWIRGRTEIAAPPEPRWSVIRNVLHWVD